MKALIVDDEEQARETLVYYLNEFFPDVEIVGRCENIIEAGNVFYKTKPDVIFLDISMPHGTGFDLTSQVDFSSTLVVFVTAHSEYAIEAIKINAFDYLLKPVHIKELTRVINKVRSHRPIKQQADAEYQPQKIQLRNDGKTMIVSDHEIIYARSEGNYTKIHFMERETLMISKNIKKIEEEYLAHFPFFRTHQSYIVNLSKVIEFDTVEVTLEGGVSVPISKARHDEFREQMNKL